MSYRKETTLFPMRNGTVLDTLKRSTNLGLKLPWSRRQLPLTRRIGILSARCHGNEMENVKVTSQTIPESEKPQRVLVFQ